MKPILPPALKKGDTIGIMAPSSRVDRAKMKAGIACLEARGFTVFVHKQSYKKDNQSAGTGAEKAAALHDLFRNPNIKAVIAARGGNRSAYMLEHLDYTLIKKNPKILMGYSDATALLNGINRKTGLVTFHGPLLDRFARDLDEDDQCFDLLAGKRTSLSGKILSKGRGKGPLVGGCLSMLCSLMGTPWQPRFKDAILFIEDAGDQMSRYDRMLLQLRNAGVFHQIAGLVVGTITENKDTGVVPFGFKLDRILRDLTGDTGIPVITDAPFGHGKHLTTLPIGINATLNGGTLRLDEPAVKGRGE